jgi:NAD(P)-dependent dehydrogenase (short-subunit alcohol dehydrogenase family)
MAGPWLYQKCIVIIGGTTGIGFSAAEAFVEHGAKVVVVGRTEETVNKATGVLKENGAGVVGDAAMPGTASRAINLCKEKFGSFHGLYHVAGGSGRKYGDGPLHELTLDGWNQTFKFDLTHVVQSGSHQSFSGTKDIRNHFEYGLSSWLFAVTKTFCYACLRRYKIGCDRIY